MDEIIPNLQQSGRVGVIPTDTVYGVVTKATDQAAVTRLYLLKHREAKPGTIIAANIEQLEAIGIKRRYLRAVEQFWPASLSVIVPVMEPSLDYLHQGLRSLAVRIPDDSSLRKVLAQCGPLLTSSANLPGMPPAETIPQAKAYFQDKVDFYVDGGSLAGRQPSTIIRIVDDAIEVIRQGAVTIPDL